MANLIMIGSFKTILSTMILEVNECGISVALGAMRQGQWKMAITTMMTFNAKLTWTHDATGDDLFGHENSEFIAAANPATVIELIRRLRDAQEKIDSINASI